MSPLCLPLTTDYLFLSIQEEIEESKDYEVEEVVEEDNWEPDERAITDPEGFRINTWVNTLLGTEKEQEREREMIGIQTNGRSAIPRDSASTHGKTHCKRERLRKSERGEFSECCDWVKQNYNNFWNGVRITRSRERERNHFFISMIDITGKNYQELRVQKRERKQPSTIPDLPYLHWERTGHAPAGPYSVCISYYCSLLISCEIDKNISYMKFKQVLFSCEFHDKYNFLYFTVFVW